MKIAGFLESLARDLRHALRGLPRRPAFTIAAVLTLALGIGATTAIFSVVYSVLIKPLPFPNAAELVRIRHPAPGLGVPDLGSSPAMFFTYRKENRTFVDIGLWGDGGQTLTSNGETVRLRSLRVTDGLLQALGVQPLRGRWFTAQEEGPAPEGLAPVILSYAFWQSRFSGEESALGRQLLIDGRPSQVVGIMPRDFRFLNLQPQPEIIVAIPLDPANASIVSFGGENALGRLKPGVTPEQARADIERMLPIWAQRLAHGAGCDARGHSELARGLVRAAAEGRSRRQRREHAVGADGRHRCGAAGGLREHREPDARAGGRAAAGVRRARGARRRARAHCTRAVHREPGDRRIGRCARLGARLRRHRGARLARAEQPAAAWRDCRVSAGAAVHRRHGAALHARVRLAHGIEARGARGCGRARRLARRQRGPRACAGAQHAGGGAGGARARAGGERGADDSHVRGAAQRGCRLRGSGHDSDGAHLATERAVSRRAGVYAPAARDPGRHRGAARCGVGGLHGHAADGGRAVHPRRADRRGRPAARRRRHAAAAPGEARVAGLPRGHGHADRRGARHDLERHRRRRPRGADLRGALPASSRPRPRLRSACGFARRAPRTPGAR